MNIQSIAATLKSATQNTTTSASSNSDFSPYLKSTTLDDLFQKAATTYQVPVNLLKAIGLAESSFHVDATSRCGAQGIMQLMPATAKSLGVTDAYDPEQNIMGGAKYISSMLQKYNGDASLALAAYNAGSNSVSKYGGIPPFKETQNYVKTVLKTYQEGVTIPASRNKLTSVGTNNTNATNVAPILTNNQVTLPTSTQTATTANSSSSDITSNTAFMDQSLIALSQKLDEATSFSFKEYGSFIKAYFQGLTNSTFLEKGDNSALETEMDGEIKKLSQKITELSDKSDVTDDDYKHLNQLVSQINSGLQLQSSDLYKSYQNIQYNPAILSMLASSSEKTK